MIKKIEDELRLAKQAKKDAETERIKAKDVAKSKKKAALKITKKIPKIALASLS